MKLSKPRMKAVRFDQEDVITTSGVFTRPLLHLAGWGDDDADNNTFSYGAQGELKSWILGNNHEAEPSMPDSGISFLKEYVGSDLSDKITSGTQFVVPGTLSLSVVTLVLVEDEDFSVFNGSYQYDTSQYKFIKTN